MNDSMTPYRHRISSCMLLSRLIHSAVLTTIRLTNVTLFVPCRRQPCSKNIPNDAINSQWKYHYFPTPPFKNFFFCHYFKTYSATNVPGKESLNFFGPTIVFFLFLFIFFLSHSHCPISCCNLVPYAGEGWFLVET